VKKVDLVAVMKDGAEEIGRSFTDPNDDWFPVVMIQTGEAIIPVILEITDDREATGRGLEVLLRNTGAEQAVLVSSSWFVIRGPGDIGDSYPVRDQPDRKEVLVMTHVTRDSMEMMMADIHRHESKPPTLGPWSDPADGLSVSGIFADAMRLGIG
jgi:hypothetical protein